MHDKKAPKADAPPRQSAEERADAALLVTSRRPYCFSVPLPGRR
jgi:hypothetical protein